ncbi:MAG TPA: YaiI/YqxD family protein [Fibrobacteria bacterium]|nr:YaiI/YqxD family protein [Fibrobacteria bacterium]
MHTVYIDADACPVKDEVYQVARRHGWPVIVVANAPMRIPAEASIRLQVVSEGFDAADDWIVERAGPGDVVVTSDIPLADRSLKQGAFALGNTGRPFTEENIGDALASREISSELREMGVMRGGPAPFQKKDRSEFLQQLDKAIHALKRRFKAALPGGAPP